MPSISSCRCVLVIGATSGLGRALGLAIRDLPSKPTVIAAGRRAERLEELAQENGVKVEQLDVSLPSESLISAVNAILARHHDASLTGVCRVKGHIADCSCPFRSMPLYFQLGFRGRSTFVIPAGSHPKVRVESQL